MGVHRWSEIVNLESFEGSVAALIERVLPVGLETGIDDGT